MRKEEDIQKAGVSVIKELVRMDYIADDFAVSDDTANLQFFDFPTRTTDLAFGLCYQGTAEIEIDLKKKIVRPDSFIAIFPGQVIRLVSKTDDFTAHIAAMSEKFMNSAYIGMEEKLPLILYIKDNPITSLKHADVTVVKEYFSLLQHKTRTINSENKRNIILHLIQALFYEGSDILQKYKPIEEMEKSRKQEIFAAFNQLVQQHFSVERKVIFYAGKLFLTPKYLSAVVKEVSGKFANEWIDDYVMQEAKILLKTSDLTVQQISDKLHFATPSHFGNYFSHHEGVAPNRYRKSQPVETCSF